MYLRAKVNEEKAKDEENVAVKNFFLSHLFSKKGKIIFG